MKTVNVYAAGKIQKNDWRNVRDFAHDLASWRVAAAGGGDRPVTLFPHLGVRLQYIGPFFISCDHGGWHGPQTHGVGEEALCCVEAGPPRREVLDASLSAIERADVVYVRLDAADAFGTLVELGYALRAGKPIYVDIADDLPEEVRADLWFAIQAAECRPPADDVIAALVATFGGDKAWWTPPSTLEAFDNPTISY